MHTYQETTILQQFKMLAYVKHVDYIIAEEINKPDTPPFLGLISVDDEVIKKIQQTLPQLIQRKTEKAVELLETNKNFAAWFLCRTVQQNYGQDGNSKVWPYLEKALYLEAKSLEPPQIRKKIHSIVSNCCREYVLPVPPESLIDLFTLHAGVSTKQLKHLVRAFVMQERAIGLPSNENTVELNSWEDEALEFITDSLQVLRRPILWDTTAWHAQIYIQYRENQSEHNSPYIQPFIEAIKEIEKNPERTSIPKQQTQKIRLVMEDMGIALKIPQGTERIPIYMDDGLEPRRIKSGITYRLPHPTPRKIRIGEQSDLIQVIEILPKDTDILIGDLDTEGELQPIIEDKKSLIMTQAIIFARKKIEGRNIECYPTNENLYYAICNLDTTRQTIKIGERCLTLSRHTLPKLIIRGKEIAKSSNGKLHSLEAELFVATGIDSKDHALKIRLGNNTEKIIDIDTDERGDCKNSLEFFLKKADINYCNDPTYIKINLMRGKEIETRHKLKAAIWPGFEQRKNNEIHCLAIPSNLNLEASRGISFSENKSQSTIYIQENELQPKITFHIEKETITYTLPPGDISLLHILPDGSKRPIPIGSNMMLDEKSRGGAIQIITAHKEAILQIPKSKIFDTFEHRKSHTLSMRDLESGWISILKEHDVEIKLVELFDSCEYENLHLDSDQELLNIILTLKKDTVDALRADIENEKGERKSGFIGFKPTVDIERPVSWFDAEAIGWGEIVAKFYHKEVPCGIWLGTLSVYENEDWKKITSPDGNIIYYVLSNGQHKSEDHTVESLNSILQWLKYPRIPEIDNRVEPVLTKRKREIVDHICQQTNGNEKLLSLILCDKWYDNASDWMPPLHLLFDYPEIFETNISDFHSMTENLTFLAQESDRLRDNENIDVRVLFAFSNSLEAYKTDEPLRGLDFSKMMKVLEEHSPKNEIFLGDYWSGTPLMGHAHWKAAHKHLQNRIEQSQFFENHHDSNSDNEKRSIALKKVYSSPIVRKTEEIPIPDTVKEVQENTHKWISRTLRSFCSYARRGQTRQWIKEICYSQEQSEKDVIRAVGDAIQLAPELFIFHLLVAHWEESRR